jgi:aminoglycoside 6-adenylyltransferase
MLVTMLEWYVGTNTKFTVSTGKYGKFLEQYLEVEVWKKFVDTYSDGYSNNLWLSLVNMCHLFREIGQSVAQHLNYDYPASEEEKVLSYLTNVKQLPKRNTDNM